MHSYGDGPKDIDRFFRVKREWSKVKDLILSGYIDCYLKTIPRRGRPIMIVDAFSGPGRFGDSSLGSPLILCEAIDKSPKHRVGVGCLFSDSHPPHRTALEENLAEYIAKGTAAKPLLDFQEVLAHAIEAGKYSTLFFYLDPYGIKDLEFSVVRQIYERNKNQSTEVLINFNFKTFMRMSGNWSLSDSCGEIAQKVKDTKVQTVNAVMGGDYWIKIVTDPSLGQLQREDAVVDAYVELIRQYFPFAHSIPVKEREEGSSVPADELAKYHLIFGTRSARAVRYMNDVALNALKPYFDQFVEGLLFPMTPERFSRKDTDLIKAAILRAVEAKPLTRPQIYEAVIPNHFLQYKSTEYRAMIADLAFVEKKLYPDPRKIKKPNQLNDETPLSLKPW